mgnify:CR=1 FL=1|jgi:uncharacterized membrane protein
MKINILRIMAILTGLIGTTLFNRFMDGGALFMSLILICLLTSIYFIVKSILKIKSNVENSKKMIKHIGDCGTLALALGVMGAFLGFIAAFDAIESGQVEVNVVVIASGLKIALLSPIFGLFNYSVSRVSILVLRIIQK